jgi:hypothetical protein
MQTKEWGRNGQQTKEFYVKGNLSELIRQSFFKAFSWKHVRGRQEA